MIAPILASIQCQRAAGDGIARGIALYQSILRVRYARGRHTSTVLRRSGLSPEQCLFVDDLEPNIKAAQDVGLNTIHFKGVADLKERLAKLGFKV